MNRHTFIHWFREVRDLLFVRKWTSFKYGWKNANLIKWPWKRPGGCIKINWLFIQLLLGLKPLGLKMKPLLISLVRGWIECLVRHLLERWWLRTRVCSILRRFWSPIVNVLGWFLSFCCLAPHCQPTPRSRHSSTPTQLPSRQVRQLRFSRRSGLSSIICAYDQLGIEDPLWTILTWPWLLLFRLFLFRTFWDFLI